MPTTDIGMTMEDLEEAIAEALSSNNFEIKKVKGKIVIYTNLSENEYGELVDVDEEEESEDSDEDDLYEDDADLPDDIED